MSSPESLLQATLNRLTARLSKQVINTANKVAIFLEEAPNTIKQEWEVFQQEVIAEADLIENRPNEQNTTNTKTSVHEIPQEKIDRLRSKVRNLSGKIETIS